MAEKRNVLFIVSDDLRPELGCYGKKWIHSPNIDRLASEGILFERAYCQQAVCAPSRSSVLSGCRPETTGIHDLQTPLRTAMPDVLSMPEHFRNHGYETVSIGKVYHHAQDDLQGWTGKPFQSKGDWKGRGYLTDEAVESIHICDTREKERGSSRRGLGPAYECADVPDEAYHDGKDTLAVIKELHRLSRSDSPFFLGYGLHKPHLPFNAPKRYWDIYDHDTLPLASNPFKPENVTEFSLHNFGELRGYFDIPETGRIEDDLARNLVHAYAACISYIDAQIGMVLDELQRLGLKENTAIIFWGDHGWKLGEHDCWCKHTNFEIDAHAPLIFSMPGLEKKGGLRTDALVEFVDMYPSLCETCSIPVPEHCEGSSFIPLTDDPDTEWKPAAFNLYPRRDVMGYAVRTERFRYVEWKHSETGDVCARELYDHSTDPQENINAAEKEEYSTDVRTLSSIIDKGWKEALPPA